MTGENEKTEAQRAFDALSKDRASSAQTLAKPSMRGVKTSVVEKYSDQAHFVYELLQNADDAFAENARFVLERKRLIFVHDGTRRFSVSDPQTEEQDAESGALGDINAITSIANSNKTEGMNKIGKFGVGFKAVFQYTETPLIYDSAFRFKIESFIVPVALEKDFAGRRENETAFIFPFNHPKRKSEEAFSDIAGRLKELKFPLLFLSCLKRIEFEIRGDKTVFGSYEKEIRKTFGFEGTKAQLILLTQSLKDQPRKAVIRIKRKGKTAKVLRSEKAEKAGEASKTVATDAGAQIKRNRLWLFSRADKDTGTYSAGFFVGEDGSLCAMQECAFCFFPTKVDTALSFIIHAPFLLTDSREGIRSGESHNKNMISLLADLAADSFVYLREIGKTQGKPLIDDGVTSILPFDGTVFDAESKQIFKPFYDKIKAKFQTEKLLPSRGGYVKKENAYWAAVIRLAELFSDEQIACLFGNPNAHWVFVSFGRDENVRTKKVLASYIDELACAFVNEEAILKTLTTEFIERQSVDWLHNFYKWLSETDNRTKQAQSKAIFLNQDKKAVASCDGNGERVLFLPSENSTGFQTVYLSLVENKETLAFFEKLGMRKPALKDCVYKVLLPKYGELENLADGDFKQLFKYYRECPNKETGEYIGAIKKKRFRFRCRIASGSGWFAAENTFYMPTEELVDWFAETAGIIFIDFDEYKELVGTANEEDAKHLHEFFVKLGAIEKVEDFIGKVLLQKYGKDENLADEDFKILFEHYLKNSNIINSVKEKKFRFHGYTEQQPCWAAIDSPNRNSLYIPTKELLSYFETKPTAYFLDFDAYKKLVGTEKENPLREFFLNLGAKDSVEVFRVPVEPYSRSDLPCPRSTREREYDEAVIDGLKELIEYTVANKSKEKSVLAWNTLLDLIKRKCASYDEYHKEYRFNRSLSSLLKGRCYYFYYSPYYTEFDSSDAVLLKTAKWLVNKNGNFVSASQTSRLSLSADYDVSSALANELLGFLNIPEKTKEEDDSDFPSSNVKNWGLLKKHAAQELYYADPVIYEYVKRRVRTSKNYGDVRTYLENMYAVGVQSYACQMCRTKTAYFTATQITNENKVELDPLHLCLCTNCGREYQNNRNSVSLVGDFANRIAALSDREIESASVVKIPFADKSIWFTQTHAAEIRELLRLQSAKEQERTNL